MNISRHRIWYLIVLYGFQIVQNDAHSHSCISKERKLNNIKT